MKTYPYVDLSRMLALPKCAVMCRTEDEAEAFWQNSRTQFEKYFQWGLEGTLGSWGNYKEKTGFTLMAGSSRIDRMSYCREEWFAENGYELVEFSELADAKDIEESEMSFDALLSQDSASTPS